MYLGYGTWKWKATETKWVKRYSEAAKCYKGRIDQNKKCCINIKQFKDLVILPFLFCCSYVPFTNACHIIKSAAVTRLQCIFLVS